MDDSYKDVLVSWAGEKGVISELYLFGSRVRGDHSLKSDLDVGLVLNEEKNSSILAIWIFECKVWEEELNQLLPIKIDLQLANQDHSDSIVWLAIQEHGILIYRKEKL